VRAKVFDGGDFIALATVEGNPLAADGAAEWFFVNFVGSGGNVPGIFGEHDGDLVGSNSPCNLAGMGGCGNFIQYAECDSLYGMTGRSTSPI
jgi:hypothetical protein